MTTNTLLHDPAKCGNGEECLRRDPCVRWIAAAYNDHQGYAAFFVEGAECDVYWPAQGGQHDDSHAQGNRRVAHSPLVC
jgi:hypothetical protein